VHGTWAHLLELPDRAFWDLQPAHWGAGRLAVNQSPDPRQPVVCFAPPGTPLFGESGPDVIGWRRGVWRSEEDFIARRRPAAVDQLRFQEASESIPSDFAPWVQRETASHLEMVRPFLRERPRLESDQLCSRARELRDELEAFDPGAFDHLRDEVELAAARIDLGEHRRQKRERELPAPISLTFPILARFTFQATLFASLYGLYRVLRPDGPTAGFQVSLDGLSTAVAFDVLMWVYGNAHVLVAFAFLGWVFFRRHGAFDFVRNATLVAAAASIVPSLLLFPASTYGPDWSHHIPASAVPTIPSLHLSIAIIAGFWGAVLSRSRPAKLMWAGYPLLSLAAVIASKPLDPGIAVATGFAAALIGLAVALAAGRVHHAWGPPPVPDLAVSRPLRSHHSAGHAVEVASTE